MPQTADVNEACRDFADGPLNEPARAGEGGTRLAACLRLVTKMIKDG